MKVTLSIIGFFLALIALGWALMANNLAMTSVFAPMQEQVRRNTFEQSKAYNDGMIKELEAMQFEYIQAEPEHQAALRSLILNRAVGFPNDNLPPDLKNFLNELKAK